MLIKKGKNDICPVCQYKIRGHNYWVKYHVSYTPNLEILACRFCNYTEWAMRNGKVTRLKCATPARIYGILQIQKKFEILSR